MPNPPIANVPGAPGYQPPGQGGGQQQPGMPTNPISGVLTVYMYVPGQGLVGPYHLTPGSDVTVPTPPTPDEGEEGGGRRG